MSTSFKLYIVQINPITLPVTSAVTARFNIVTSVPLKMQLLLALGEISRRFKGLYCLLLLQAHAASPEKQCSFCVLFFNCLILKWKALWIFEISRETDPNAQHHIQDIHYCFIASFNLTALNIFFFTKRNFFTSLPTRLCLRTALFWVITHIVVVI